MWRIVLKGRHDNRIAKLVINEQPDKLTLDKMESVSTLLRYNRDRALF